METSQVEPSSNRPSLSLLQEVLMIASFLFMFEPSSEKQAQFFWEIPSFEHLPQLS